MQGRKFAEVLIPSALNDNFTYLAIENQQIGDVVLVEFGRQKIWSIVVEINDKPRLPDLELSKIKSILEIHSRIKLSIHDIKFIDSIASYNLASRGLIARSIIGILNTDKVKKDFANCQQNIDLKKFNLKNLSPFQQEIFLQIVKDLPSSSTSLIDGITGSGKTEIFFQLLPNYSNKILSLKF